MLEKESQQIKRIVFLLLIFPPPVRSLSQTENMFKNCSETRKYFTVHTYGTVGRVVEQYMRKHRLNPF